MRGPIPGQDPFPDHPADAPITLAPQHLRLFAFIVDYLVILVLLKLGEQISLGAHWDLRLAATPPPRVWGPWMAWMILLILLKDSLGGRSPGKWVAGIAVARADAPALPPTLGQSLVRNLSLVLLPVDGVMVFADRYYRRLGDRWAKTVVVIPGRVAAPTRRLLLLAMLFLGSLLASFLVARWNLFRSAAYQTAERIAAGRPEVWAAVGKPTGFGADPDIAWPTRPDENRATVTLVVEGDRGEARVEVVLLLDRARSTWKLSSIRLPDVRHPDSPVQPAPPRPAGS